MQLGGGGGGGQQSQYMINEQPVEAASPISSRPPASAATGNSDEFMRLASGGDDGAGGGEEEGDRSGGGAGGGVVASGGNRWPRQETLALLKIRSDMDSTFRDAPVKGPLWEDVSRKLAELGYKRSAKKCREKFENVHKYYKRTKEGRVGRQDGKSYKFFSELEAFHTSPSAATAMDAVPVSAVIPMPVSSVRNIPPTSTTSLPIPTMPTSSSMPGPVAVPVSAVPPPMPTAAPPITTNTLIATALEFDFSSNSSSSSQGFNDDDEEEDELGGEPSDTAGTSRKRKRRSGGGGGSSTTQMMMEFLEGLMKQVMQKQESLQQRFLEAIEKREQDRMSREEAWKRQETLRLTREHELMSQERAIAASRDEAIITFLQKITGQTIQLPTPPPTTTTTVTIPTLPPLTKPAVAPVVPPPASIRVPTPPLNQPPPSQQQQPQPPPISSEQMPLQETGGSGSGEPASSRWPKEEVLALINLRSGLDSRYQDVGPKGPLWEEISAGMLRMGYKRNAKRCKEKWENINKYYKKVKESSKKRPEDAKTCPYFHQLDALHRSKMLSGGSSSFSHSQNRPEEEDISDATLIRQPIDHQSENKTGDTVGEGNGGAAKKETQ